MNSSGRLGGLFWADADWGAINYHFWSQLALSPMKSPAILELRYHAVRKVVLVFHTAQSFLFNAFWLAQGAARRNVGLPMNLLPGKTLLRAPGRSA